MKILTVLFACLALGACTTYGYGYGYNGQGHKGGDTVLVCHKGKKTMELPRSAAQGHRNHGDRYGRC